MTVSSRRLEECRNNVFEYCWEFGINMESRIEVMKSGIDDYLTISYS